MPLDLEYVRSHFPALKNGFIYADSAGGSQILDTVVDKVTDYFLTTNVQLGADYVVGASANARVLTEAPAATTAFVNASTPDEIIWQPSTTAAFENVAQLVGAGLVQDGDELIVTPEHEANVGPWHRLANRRQLKISQWDPRHIDPKNPFAVSQRVEDLLPLITAKTRVVAFSACSNILGEKLDVPNIVKAIRKEAASKGNEHVLICLDTVAFAPHNRIDVQAFDADFVAFSYYKVYGPHLTALWVRLRVLNSLPSLAHFFLDPKDGHYPPGIRFQQGSTSYELIHGSSAVPPYISSLAGANAAAPDENTRLNLAFAAIREHEQTLLTPLIEFLKSKYAQGVRIVGVDSTDIAVRSPTISFVFVHPDEDGKTTTRNGKTVPATKITSKDIVGRVDTLRNIGIRYGAFYAYRLLTDLGLDPNDGVVRVSLVHYNTLDEVRAIIAALDPVLQ